MIKKDTMIPITYTSVICPPLQTIAATDVHPCDYEKNHHDNNKYNVSHLIAPGIDLPHRWVAQSICQSQHRENIELSTQKPVTAWQFARCLVVLIAKCKGYRSWLAKFELAEVLRSQSETNLEI